MMLNSKLRVCKYQKKSNKIFILDFCPSMKGQKSAKLSLCGRTEIGHYDFVKVVWEKSDAGRTYPINLF